MGEKIKYEIADPSFVIKQIQQLYSNPQLAFKEYVTNSLDNGARDIDIFVSKTNNLIIVQDNGIGMSYQELKTLPSRIGSSSKRDIQEARGEKGFGLLGYPTVGAKQCQVYSKKQGEDSKTYNYLRMSLNDNDAFADQLTANSFNSLIGGEFENGTRVYLNGISEEVINRFFTPSSIKAFIGEIYAPALRNDEIRLRVGYAGKRTKLIDIVAPVYPGEKVLDTSIEIDTKKEGKPIKGKIDLYLFVNPKGTNEKVGLYNKGVKVYNSISSLDELSEMPWSSGKLTGDINEKFMSLTPSREAVIRTSKRYFDFINAVKDQEEYLNEEVGRLKSDYNKHQHEDFAVNFLRTIDAIFRDMRNTRPTFVRGMEGDNLKKVIDEQANGGSTHFGTESTEDPIIKGRTTVKEDENGKDAFVRRARKIISSFYQPKFDNFEVEKEHIRSELDEEFGIVRINTGHPEYLKKEKDKNEKLLKRHIAFLLSKEVAYGEFKRMIKEIKNVDPVNEAHNLTEIIAEIYTKGTEIEGIDK